MKLKRPRCQAGTPCASPAISSNLRSAAIAISIIVIGFPIVSPQASFDDSPQFGVPRTLWVWDASLGNWAAADDAKWASSDDGMRDNAGAKNYGRANRNGDARGRSSWTEWFTPQRYFQALGVEYWPAAAPSDRVSPMHNRHRDTEAAPQREHGRSADGSKGTNPTASHPGDAADDNKLGSVLPKPGGFPWIDPEGRLAQEGVTQLNPDSCPSRGTSLGADGVLYFLSTVPGTRNKTVLVVASRPKNSTWVFRKVRMPRRSSGIVSCGAVDGGPLLGEMCVTTGLMHQQLRAISIIISNTMRSRAYGVIMKSKYVLLQVLSWHCRRAHCCVLR